MELHTIWGGKKGEFRDWTSYVIKRNRFNLTDETGSIALVLWEKDIDRVQNGLTYKITQALVTATNTSRSTANSL